MRYRISEDAERDLDEIFVYWAHRTGLEIADRIIDRITERFWMLGEHPNGGKPAGNVAPGVKCFPAGKYLIYYRNTRSGTDILHVFHGARDQRRAFRTARKRK
jgi:toxin ParE1/3/4